MIGIKKKKREIIEEKRDKVAEYKEGGGEIKKEEQVKEMEKYENGE